MSELLDSSQISFSYGDRWVLHEVALQLRADEVVALIGPNGSGKSTLMRCLLGHLSASGSIHWGGRALRSWSTRGLARRVAYLPQSPVAEPGQTVREVLQLGRTPYLQSFGIESSQDQQVVLRISEQLGLTELLKRPIDQLSGGQRQRVFVGRCLVQEPKAMLLDEPSTFLDLKHQIEFGKLARELARSGIGVLMASHDLNLAGMFADRVVILSEGRIAADGAPSIVLQGELLGTVFGVEMESIRRSDGTMIVAPKVNE